MNLPGWLVSHQEVDIGLAVAFHPAAADQQQAHLQPARSGNQEVGLRGFPTPKL
jgi:hypothetical protein